MTARDAELDDLYDSAERLHDEAQGMLDKLALRYGDEDEFVEVGEPADVIAVAMGIALLAIGRRLVVVDARLEAIDASLREIQGSMP
jgi:hypothetical protein